MPVSPPGSSSPSSPSTTTTTSSPSSIAATSNTSPSLLSRGLPRLVMTGVLWITLVMTAAQLFVLSHVGFIVLNCFSHLTSSPPASRGYSLQQQQQQQRQRRRGEEEDEDEDVLTDNPFSLPALPFPNNNINNNGNNSYSTRSAAAFRRYMQSNTQANNLAANAGGGMVKKTIPRDDWNARLGEIQVDRDDLNKLIMNYLIIEGYKDAAEKFSQESGAKPPVNLESIQDRMIVRTAIQRGHIEEAIERVNDLNPEILDTNPKLFFHLQQQRLIEYIREGRILEALEFAQEELAPRGEENPEFLSELERTMSLLAFDVHGTSPVSDLLTGGQKQKLASELNSALLLSQSQEKDPKLPALLKMCWWAQQQLDERCVYPKIKDFTRAELMLEPMGTVGGGSIGGGSGTGSAATSSGAVAGGA
ncbi:hypothetical protein BGZ83_006774 [Gryganskiella cystojenkinii]|nr:hypothetical protein BGZ83_006774 [Gryganskiella cystojenkinii]